MTTEKTHRCRQVQTDPNGLFVVHHLKCCISADVFGFPAISMPDGFLVPVKNQGDVSTTRMQV